MNHEEYTEYILNRELLKTKKEEWKQVQGFENYKVSNFGRIKRTKNTITVNNNGTTFQRTYPEKLMKLSVDSQGYRRVGLTRNKQTSIHYVHHLVADHFLGDKSEDKPVVLHINDEKDNNSIWDLRRGTYQDNLLDRSRYGYTMPQSARDAISKANSGYPKNQKLSESDVIYIRRYAGDKTQAELADQFNVTQANISHILNDRSWTTLAS